MRRDRTPNPLDRIATALPYVVGGTILGFAVSRAVAVETSDSPVVIRQPGDVGGPLWVVILTALVVTAIGVGVGPAPRRPYLFLLVGTVATGAATFLGAHVFSDDRVVENSIAGAMGMALGLLVAHLIGGAPAFERSQATGGSGSAAPLHR